MDVMTTPCCALNIIEGISEYEGHPEEALLEVCENVQDTHGDLLSELRAFYIFTAVLKEKERPRTRRYGPELRDYIRRKGLGHVTESLSRMNRTGAPNHLVRVYIWTPNARAVSRWYAQRKGKEEV